MYYIDTNSICVSLALWRAEAKEILCPGDHFCLNSVKQSLSDLSKFTQI